MLQMLQLMQKNKADIISGQQDIQVLRNEDCGTENPAGGRAFDAAGCVQIHLATDAGLSHA